MTDKNTPPKRIEASKTYAITGEDIIRIENMLLDTFPVRSSSSVKDVLNKLNSSVEESQ